MRKLVLFSLALGMSLPTYSFVKVNKDKDRIQKTSDSYRKVDQEVVQGKVTSKSGPLPGATVSVVGGESTQTDAEGNYSVKAKVGATLRVSMVGYATKEVIVTGTTVNIDLDEQGTALDEVVVVGYGTQRRGNLTGAVSTVNIKDNLEGRTVVDVGRAIQGTTPGLNITIPSGEVGSDPLIKIRGAVASITGSSSPLILLDNVEIPSILYVNPDDIESITVLKDAAASSIYGAKASTGVILITTKTGAAGKPSINYSNNFSYQNLSKKFEMGTINALKYSIDAMERVGATVYSTLR